MEIQLQNRRDLMDGYILSPTGATIADAIRTADISIPANRERLLAKGNVILTVYNANSMAADLVSQPPSVEVCERVLKEIASRRKTQVEFLQSELDDAKAETSERDLNRGERSFWKARLRAIEAKLDELDNEAPSPQDLYKAFVQEDVSLRAKAVPPELRAAMEAVERERALATL